MADIGILGGTFDPIHFAHLEIAKAAKEQLGLDKVLFLTSGNPPHKKGRPVTDKKIRNEMVAASISGYKDFELCDYEVLKKEYSYTSETLEYLKAKNPLDNLYLIIGEDSLAYLEKWHEPEIIVKNAEIAVYARGENSDLDFEIKRIKNLLNAKIKVIEAPRYDLSSTEIRESVKNGKDISELVPKAAADIIKREKLYL